MFRDKWQSGVSLNIYLMVTQLPTRVANFLTPQLSLFDLFDFDYICWRVIQLYPVHSSILPFPVKNERSLEKSVYRHVVFFVEFNEKRRHIRAQGDIEPILSH